MQGRKLLTNSPQTSEKLLLSRGRTGSSAPVKAKSKVLRQTDISVNGRHLQRRCVYLPQSLLVATVYRSALTDYNLGNQARSAIKTVPASLFCILFSDKPEKSMPPEASGNVDRRNDMTRGATARRIETCRTIGAYKGGEKEHRPFGRCSGIQISKSTAPRASRMDLHSDDTATWRGSFLYRSSAARSSKSAIRQAS